MDEQTGTGSATPPEEPPTVDPTQLLRPAKLAWAKQTYAYLSPQQTVPGDDELLDKVALMWAEIKRRKAAAEEEVAEAPAPAELPPEMLEGLPPAVVAFMALQAQNTAKMTEAIFGLAEAAASRAGTEIKLSGTPEDLLHQLSGTTSAGPPPENPLPEPVRFISKGAMFNAVRTARYRQVMPDGTQHFSTGISYNFAPYGRFETVDPDAVAWLRSRPGMNVEYWEETAPPFSAPDPGVILDKVLAASLSLDDEALRALEEDEMASHKRKVVLDTIKSARRRVQDFERGED